MPFTGAAMTPDEAGQVREAVARERGNDDPFDLCVWGFAEQASAYEAAGVTWLVHAAAPDDPLAAAQRTVTAGPPSG